MGMQSHEWVSAQMMNERANGFYREAEVERLANIARANQPEAGRVSLKRVADYMVSPLKRAMQQPKPAQQRKVLVRDHRRAV